MPAIYDGEPGALGLCINHFSSREKSGDVAPCQEKIGDVIQLFGGTLGRQQNVAAFHFFMSGVWNFSLCEFLFDGCAGTSFCCFLYVVFTFSHGNCLLLVCAM
jgi:hypothetical protein